MAGQDKAKFVISVGSANFPLGEVSRGEAIEQANRENSRSGGDDIVVKLFEQTVDRGAVNIPFKIWLTMPANEMQGA